MGMFRMGIYKDDDYKKIVSNGVLLLDSDLNNIDRKLNVLLTVYLESEKHKLGMTSDDDYKEFISKLSAVHFEELIKDHQQEDKHENQV